MAVLCIDFGTSSIRATFRGNNTARKVLDLGRVTGAKSLDDASLRSDVYLASNGLTLLFGEAAVLARSMDPDALLYESSPKLWLRTPGDLDKTIVATSKLTQRDVLAGLISFAIDAARKAVGEKNWKEKIEVRIAHPLWDNESKSESDLALREVAGLAWALANSKLKLPITDADVLHQVCGDIEFEPLTAQCDVIEPVAAALELLPNESNVKKLCAVLDVGAGTTDIGLFDGFNPDASARVHQRLCPVGLPASLFLAGNEIDRILLKILETRSQRRDKISVADVRSRIRFIKESLFKDGFIRELDVRIDLGELEQHPAIMRMSNMIRAELQRSLTQESRTVLELVRGSVHTHNHIEVVMAGGGGDLKFLHRALAAPFLVDGQIIKVEISSPAQTGQENLFGASLGRLAVALGGVTKDYENLVQSYPTLTSTPGLGLGKQVIKTLVQPIVTLGRGRPPQDLGGQRLSRAIPEGAQLTSEQLLNKLSEHAYQSPEWFQAMTALKHLADAGDAQVQFKIGSVLSERGNDPVVAKDAFGWYSRAARQGLAESQVNLGVLYVNGKGVKKSMEDAWFWWSIASCAGHQTATKYLNLLSSKLPESVRQRLSANALLWRSTVEPKA
jgi:hypothetical protein